MTGHVAEARRSYGWWLYAALLALLAAFTVGGYGLFRVFVTDVMPDLSAYNLLALAILAGVASFFSPCVFPMLPAYLSVFYSSTEQSTASVPRLRRAIGSGAAAALGVVTFDLALGALVGLLGAAAAKGLAISGPQPNSYVRLFRGSLGVVLASLGAAQLAGVNLKPRLADAFAWRVRPRHDQARPRPALSLYLYGLGYNAAGMGCTGPILAGLMVFALSTASFGAALSTFALFSATMGALMLLVSALAATSQETLIRRLKAAAPRIKRASSLLLVGAGLFNVVSALAVSGFVRLLFP